MSARSRLNLNWIGVLILALCYAAALLNVFKQKQTEETHDVIRLAHWQLELGVRDGLDELIKRFEEKKAAEGQAVKVMQIPIPGQVYQQYAITQLVGGSPPDLIQIGKFPERYLERYFTPLSQDIRKPNPYIAERWEELSNKPQRTAEEEGLLTLHAELKDQAWSDSFTDGLRSMFFEQSQEYYGVGFSQFTIRMFYNKDLFREALGHDRAPSTYEELVDACEALNTWADKEARIMTPIASSRFQVNLFKLRYVRAMTADVGFDHDIDRNGIFSPEERLAGIMSGAIGPWSPEYRAANELLLSLAGYFPAGFMAMEHMDANFSFVQQQSAMIMSGSWDAHSLLAKVAEQPEDQRFDIGVFDIPQVSADHPEFGAHFDGRITEATTGTQFPMAITRRSQNRELCIEFLQFCTTPENNSRLNKRAQWIPAVRGADMHDFLKPFAPDFTGYGIDTMMQVSRLGSQVRLIETQAFWPYIQGEDPYETYESAIADKIEEALIDDAMRLYREPKNILPEIHARRSGQLSQIAFGDNQQKTLGSQKLIRTATSLAAQSRRPARIEAMLQSAGETPTNGSPITSDIVTDIKNEMKAMDDS